MGPISPDPPDPPDTPECMETSHSTLGKRHKVDNEHPYAPKKKTIVEKESSAPSLQTEYSDPTLSILGSVKEYIESDAGPFIVHVSRPASITSGIYIRPVKFGQFLHKNKIEEVCLDGVKRAGRNKVAVEFKSAKGANTFLQNTLLQTSQYEVYIPTYNITRMGLVRGIPVDLNIEEVVKNVQIPNNNVKILKARRLNRKVQQTDGSSAWEPSQTVVITFRGQQLPVRILLFYSSLPVEIYNYPTIQCLHCCRFGHTKNMCRSKPRCFKCAQPHYGGECHVKESAATCLYCSAQH